MFTIGNKTKKGGKLGSIKLKLAELRHL